MVIIKLDKCAKDHEQMDTHARSGQQTHLNHDQISCKTANLNVECIEFGSHKSKSRIQQMFEEKTYALK